MRKERLPLKYSAIFQPLTVGPLTWRNRIEIAPAAPFLTWREEDGRMPLKSYYTALAGSGAALINLGIGSLEDDPRFPGMVRPACCVMKLEDLPELVDTLHRDGCLAGVELTVSRYMMGPRDRITSIPESEVKNIIAAYAFQARRAREAGFDMILIHGGHGNVPAQFFASYINHRTDAYGGSPEKRSRFALEMLDAVRNEMGSGMALEYRISAEEVLPGTTTFEETLAFAERIQDKIDLLHVSRGLLEEDATLPVLNSPVYVPRGTNIPYARVFRERLNIPVSVVCGMDLDTAEKAILAGDVDAAAMIRTALADPSFVAKAKAGREAEIRPCVRCNTCIGRTHSDHITVRCAVNPLVGRESLFDMTKPAAASKRVVIVGGGPAGLEAARTAAQRGHQVTLLEKSGRLGGTLRLAAAADFKADMKRYLDWSIRTVEEDQRIDLRLNTEATPELLRELNPDAILLAIGARPIIPKLAACPEKAVWVGELEGSPEKAGQRVVVAGAGFTGLEMALDLAQHGREVTVIDLLPAERIGADGVAISMIWLKAALKEAGVRFLCQVRLEDATAEGAVVSHEDGTKELLPCDTVVLSLGVRPDRSLEEKVQGLAPQVVSIGDCSGSGGTIFKAVSGGFDAAMAL